MDKIKLKLKLHHFNAFHTALDQYIPHFINSNEQDVLDNDMSDRRKLSRHVVICIAKEIDHYVAKQNMLSTGSKVTLTFTQAQSIVLFFLLQNIPLHKDDQFTLSIINSLIAELEQEITKPKIYNF